MPTARTPLPAEGTSITNNAPGGAHIVFQYVQGNVTLGTDLEAIRHMVRQECAAMASTLVQELSLALLEERKLP